MDTIGRTQQLAIFDVDGTLTDTTGVDDECYCAAVADALGVDASAVDWTGALHVTDAGILRYLWSAHRSGAPSTEDYHRARSGFLARITAAAETNRVRFASMPGAAAALDAMRRAGWRTAVATGGWGPSARLKLRTAGIDVADETFACADDAESRAEIVTLARQKAERHFDCTFERVVSIGDGVWDVDAASRLGLAFIGIASGPRAERLRAAGAAVVLPDYSDVAAFLRALDTAPLPRVLGF